MTYPSKLVLQTPVSNWTLLEPFVQACLRDRVALVAIVGRDAEEAEDRIDDIVIDIGSGPDDFFVTSSHPDESLEDVQDFAEAWGADRPSQVQVIQF